MALPDGRGSDIEVVALLDDNEHLHGTHLGRFRIHTPDAAARLDFDAIIISSDQAEEALWRRRERFERPGIAVRRLYGPQTEALRREELCVT